MANDKPLAERIAALQQRNSSPQAGALKPDEMHLRRAGGQGLKDRIARFEAAGGIPVPKAGATFGLAAPVSSDRKVNGLIGNRIPSAGRYYVSRSRSASPTADLDSLPSRSQTPEIFPRPTSSLLESSPASSRASPSLARSDWEDGVRSSSPPLGIPELLLLSGEPGENDSVDGLTLNTGAVMEPNPIEAALAVPSIPTTTTSLEPSSSPDSNSSVSMEHLLASPMLGHIPTLLPAILLSEPAETGRPSPTSPLHSLIPESRAEGETIEPVPELENDATNGEHELIPVQEEPCPTSQIDQPLSITEVSVSASEVSEPSSSPTFNGMEEREDDSASVSSKRSNSVDCSIPAKHNHDASQHEVPSTPQLAAETEEARSTPPLPSSAEPLMATPPSKSDISVPTAQRQASWASEPSPDRRPSHDVLPLERRGTLGTNAREDGTHGTNVQRSSSVPSRRVTHAFLAPKARPSLNVVPSLPSLFGDDDDDDNYVGGWANVITTTRR